MSKISFIFFDVGGVVIKDFSNTDKWERMYLDLGVNQNDLDKMYEMYDLHKNEINLSYDFDNFIPFLRNDLKVDLPDNFSLLDELVSRFESNPKLQSAIEIAKSIGRIGLLTNMWPRMFRKIQDTGIIPNEDWLIIDSSVVNLQKPNRNIYEFAQQRAGVTPEQIVFIDNTEGHLNEPRKMGWQTFLYDSSNYDQANQDLANFLGKFS